MKFIEHGGRGGTHEKRDYPSKGDFINFNFYKTKEKKKKAVAWQLEWDQRKSYHHSVGPNNTKTDGEAKSPPTFTTPKLSL